VHRSFHQQGKGLGAPRRRKGKVVISRREKDVDRTNRHRRQQQQLKASDTVISNGRATTNCLAPWSGVDDRIGVVSG